MGLSPDALFEAVFSDVQGFVANSSDLPSECSLRQFASAYLLKSVIRKWIPKDSREADAAALESFMAANNRCKDWNVPSLEWEIDSVVYGEIRRILDEFFHPRGELLVGSYFDLLRQGRPGPGINVGANSTSYYGKYFASPLTSTSEYLYEEYRRYLSWIPLFSEAEQFRYEKFGPPQIVTGSRCSFVPKTTATSRMICVEPSLNMFYQLGLATILEDRLRVYFNIDLATQPTVNHMMARRGSRWGVFSTIDLSSASDSISLGLCEWLFPKWFFELLVTLRSRTTEINGKSVPLFMVSTMGNGFTFPLQTIIFSAVLKACSSIFSSKKRSLPDGRVVGTPRRWSCFGDDLICSNEVFDRVVHYLSKLGFSVNPSKTFNVGPFRESCGADWFLGQPVRPVFVKKLRLPWDYLVTINSLNDWSAYTGIPLRNTISLLLSRVHKKFHFFVPFDSNMDEGIRVPLSIFRPKLDRNLSFLYKSWARIPSKIRIGDGNISVPRGLKNLPFNPSGLYCSFLYGELRSLSIMVRHDRKMYRGRLRCSPYWDYMPASNRTAGVRLDWQRWNNAVSFNLRGE